MAVPQTANEKKLLKAIQNGYKFSKIEQRLGSFPIELDNERYFDYYLIIEALNRHRPNVATLLIKQGFRVYKTPTVQEKTVLQVAVDKCYFTNSEEKIVFISMLMTKGASLDILTPDEKNRTPIHSAINQNNWPIIELFLSKLDVKNLDEKYIMHHAIKKGNVQVVSKLIAKGCSLKKKNEKNLTPFCIALQDKKFKILNYYLLPHCSGKNIDINKQDDLAPVYIASKFGNLKIIKEYADSGLSVDIPLKLNTNTWSCLHDYSGFTLLHLAVKYVKLEVVQLLLEIGADFFVQNKNGSTPLHIAFENKEKGLWKSWQDFDDNNIIIDLMLKANAKFNSNPINKSGLSHFHIACSRDEPTVVEHFLKHNVPINQAVKSNSHLYKKFSPLHFAAKFRCSNTMKFLLENGADINQRDFNGMTALHIAAKESCLETVSLLLQYGVDISSVDSHGKTPVHWAFENKNYGMLDLLLSVPNVAVSNPINKEGVSHFHIACTRSNVNVVKSFIGKGVAIDACVPTKPDADKNGVDWSGYSPLHFAVSHNKANTVYLLLRSGANVGIKDSRGFTPLHMAYNYSYDMFGEYIETTLYNSSKKWGGVAFEFRPLTDVVKVDKAYCCGFSGSIDKINWSSSRREHMKVIDTLLNSGSDVNCTDNNGNTPVFYAYAAVTRIERVVENNLECSIALWTQILKDLSRELKERRISILNNLMKLDVNVDSCCKYGHILHHISFHDNREDDEIMELILRKSLNIDATNKEMMTPLHLATLNGNLKLISLLLDYGANVDCIDPKDNSTPLLIASQLDPRSHNVIAIVKTLVDRGANVNAKQTNGRTMLHNLTWMKYQQVVPTIIPILIKAGADVNSRESRGLTPLYFACIEKNNEVVKVLLKNGADVNVENKYKRNVFSYLYKHYIKESSTEVLNNLSRSFLIMIHMLEEHIIKMKVIGLPVSKKTLLYYSKFPAMLLINNENKRKLKDTLQKEVRKLQDTKIHVKCMLFDVIFKNENMLSQLVGNPTFKAIMKTKSFEAKFRHYGYLIQLKFQAGLDRGNLLPEAKCAINNLAKLHLPDSCTENICKYFTNVELRESVEVLRGLMNLKVDDSDEMQLRSYTARKRQKVE